MIDAEEYERGLNAIRNATLARKVVEEIRHLERDPQSGQLSPEAIQNLRKFGPDYLASVATQLEKNNAISPETRETVVKVALTATLTDQAADVVNKIDRDIRETREVWQKRGWIQAESPSQTSRR